MCGKLLPEMSHAPQGPFELPSMMPVEFIENSSHGEWIGAKKCNKYTQRSRERKVPGIVGTAANLQSRNETVSVGNILGSPLQLQYLSLMVAVMTMPPIRDRSCMRHQLGSNIGGRASTRRRYCACPGNWTAASVEYHHQLRSIASSATSSAALISFISDPAASRARTGRACALCAPLVLAYVRSDITSFFTQARLSHLDLFPLHLCFY